MLKAAVRSPCRSGRAVCFHTANGVFLYPRRQIESTPQLLIQTLAHAEMVAAGGSSVAGEQDGGGDLDPDLVKQLGRQISTTTKPDTLAQLSLEGRNETNRISVDLPNQR